MGLADRILHSDTPLDLTQKPIAIHRWTAAFTLYCLGEATRAQVIAVFNFDAASQAGLDQLKAAYDALLTPEDKNIFIQKLEAAGNFYQDGIIDSTKYKSIMGLS